MVHAVNDWKRDGLGTLPLMRHGSTHDRTRHAGHPAKQPAYRAAYATKQLSEELQDH
jgi:hypothetical protein